MIGMLDIVRTDVKPPLCKFNGLFHFRWALDGAAPDGAHGSADFHSCIVGFWNIRFTHLPVFFE